MDSNNKCLTSKNYLKARNFFDQGNYNKAEKLYKELLDFFTIDNHHGGIPDDEMVLTLAYHLAQVCIHLHRHSEAESLIKKYLDTHLLLRGDECKTNMSAQKILAIAYNNLGKTTIL